MFIPVHETVFRPTLSFNLLRKVLEATPITVTAADRARFVKWDSDLHGTKCDAEEPGDFIFD